MVWVLPLQQMCLGVPSVTFMILLKAERMAVWWFVMSSQINDLGGSKA